MKIIIGFLIAVLFIGAASLILSLERWTSKRRELERLAQEERTVQRDLDELQEITHKTEPQERTVSPAARLARVGPFTPEEAKKHHERNYAALNGCLKAIEAAGLTSEEAQTIPAQLEKAVAFESAQQLHSAAFKAFEISRAPDGRGGWKNEPEGYSCFTAYGNRKVRIGTADNYREYTVRP